MNLEYLREQVARADRSTAALIEAHAAAKQATARVRRARQRLDAQLPADLRPAVDPVTFPSENNMPEETRIIVGYWRRAREHADDLPWPEAAQVTPDRIEFANLLDSFPVVASFRGWSDCRLCGCPNGSQERASKSYQWPSGLSHYVREHGVRLDPEIETAIRAEAP